MISVWPPGELRCSNAYKGIAGFPKAQNPFRRPEAFALGPDHNLVP